MKAFKFLFSGWFMGILLLLFAYVIGYATFIENDYGAIAAKFRVYNTRWFELILFLMVVNFTGMIFTKKLYLKSKLNILIIHIALVIIIIGAGVTRYFGHEGQMHIRNGKISSIYTSTNTYLQLNIESGDFSETINEGILLAQGSKSLLNNTYDVNGQELNVSVLEYYPNAAQTIEEFEEGESILEITAGGESGNERFYLKNGETKMLYDFGVSFGDTSKSNFIQILKDGGELFYSIPKFYFPNDSLAKLNKGLKSLPFNTEIKIGTSTFKVLDYKESARFAYQNISEDNFKGSRIARVEINNQDYFIPINRVSEISINDLIIGVYIGNRPLSLPFAIKLNSFELERYPGSNSPSSFASNITVVDSMKNLQFPYKIYMNHILNYEGYRFFQSSYDTDEQGTILTVNYDYWGTIITYIGYFLLFGSLIVSFFTNKTRFARITMQLKDVHEKRKKMKIGAFVAILMLVGSQSIYAQSSPDFAEHANKFGQLFIQNNQGRIEPVNTIANKVVVKISKKSSYNGMKANEVFLKMIINPRAWEKEAIIKVPEKSIQEFIGVNSDLASFSDFMDENGSYKIGPDVELAYQKKPALRTKHDKGLINVDERINVLYMVLNGSILKIFPIPNDANNKWVSPENFHRIAGHGTDNGDLFESYLIELSKAFENSNFQNADEGIVAISNYQKTEGGDILPSEMKRNLEIFYNETNIFKKLFPFYLTFGIILVGLFFIQTFNPKREFKVLNKIFMVILILAFIIQSIGLAIRWYISGHAPWSNGYESMIYISWATMLAGFIFMKRSSITLGVTATLAGITLLTAHMSWLNPELTNLVPVLKSYWLTIHVATITASYGFLGLGCMVALLNLCIMIFRNKNNMKRINLTIRELGIIIEMALSVGLVLLIIGNFLGGIWANESWGRYWGWDPKETWTLVTIILYTFTLHLTLIPAIRNMFSFSLAAFLSFGGVLMTYFGVNYYLSGLHSYAAGDPLAVPSIVYYSIVVIAIITILSGYNEYKMKKLTANEE